MGLQKVRHDRDFHIASLGDTKDMSSIPGSERSPGEGKGNPLQQSCLKNSMDRGDLRATVHGVAESWTWLSVHTHMGESTSEVRVWGEQPRQSRLVKKGLLWRQGPESLLLFNWPSPARTSGCPTDKTGKWKTKNKRSYHSSFPAVGSQGISEAWIMSRFFSRPCQEPSSIQLTMKLHSKTIIG